LRYEWETVTSEATLNSTETAIHQRTVSISQNTHKVVHKRDPRMNEAIQDVTVIFFTPFSGDASHERPHNHEGGAE
jgi:hypothetical protein